MIAVGPVFRYSARGNVHEDAVARVQGGAFGQTRVSPLRPEGQVKSKGVVVLVQGGALGSTRLG